MMLEPSPVLLLIYVVIPALLSALVLYAVVRFGVKHGMRAYYSEVGRKPGD
ncbi:hypothetical protein [Arthrobacter subterraneus]|nr:hypothetical protein [Arthrobacter subterraneus]